MKIVKYGTVTLRHGQGPLIEGFQVEREPDDPSEATSEQLLLGLAIDWAHEQFVIAANSANLVALQGIVKRKIEAKRAEAQEKAN